MLDYAYLARENRTVPHRPAPRLPRAIDAGDEFWTEAHITCDVILEEGAHQPRKTGLLDQDGHAIMRIPERVPMGFKR